MWHSLMHRVDSVWHPKPINNLLALPATAARPVHAGHKNAVLEVHWTPDGERLLSCSPDRSVRAWDAASGQQVKKMAEHTDIVNSCCPLRRGPPLLVSGSDDGTARVWDLRSKRSVRTFTEKYQILAVEFAEAGDQIYTGGIENVVHVWDLRQSEEAALRLPGHSDSITGLRLSPDGSHLLSNAMDNTLRVWDMRPYAPANRCTKLLTGHLHNFERNLLRCDWSPDASKVSGAGLRAGMYCLCLVPRGSLLCWLAPRWPSAFSWLGVAVLQTHCTPSRCAADHLRQRRPHGKHMGCQHPQPAVQAARAPRECQRGGLPPQGAHCGLRQQRPHDLYGGARQIAVLMQRATAVGCQTGGWGPGHWPRTATRVAGQWWGRVLRLGSPFYMYCDLDETLTAGIGFETQRLGHMHRGT